MTLFFRYSSCNIQMTWKWHSELIIDHRLMAWHLFPHMISYSLITETVCQKCTVFLPNTKAIHSGGYYVFTVSHSPVHKTWTQLQGRRVHYAIATWWLVLLFVFSWLQQSLHNALLINCRPNRVDSHQICQSGFEKPRFTGLHSLMTTNQQHRCKAHSTALLAYRMPNKVQLPTMVPPSCFLWIFVASSNIKSVVWRPFLL